MKIPLLPVHILTTKTLDEKLSSAEQQTRQLSTKQAGKLLDRNFRMAKFISNLPAKYKNQAGKKRRSKRKR